MNNRNILSLITILITTACIPQLVAKSSGVGPSPVTPLSSTEDYWSYLPIVCNSNRSSPTPEPTSLPPTPSSTTDPTSLPPTPSPTTDPTSQPPTPSPTVESTPPIGQSIVANHFVVDQFDQIPDSAIQAAASKTVLFKHASTGGYISIWGLDCLQGTTYGCTYPDYKYDRQSWNWEMWDPWETSFHGKISQFESVVTTQNNNYDVLGMKFCYIDTWMTDWTDYRDMMLQLEDNYPAKTFLWTTMALLPELDIDDQCETREEFNTNIREYTQANNKPLYDIADIESHDSSGNGCFLVNGCESMCPEYVEDLGHPNQTGSIRLAKGFWWLMARIAGWNGQ